MVYNCLLVTQKYTTKYKIYTKQLSTKNMITMTTTKYDGARRQNNVTRVLLDDTTSSTSGRVTLNPMTHQTLGRAMLNPTTHQTSEERSTQYRK